MLEWRQIRASNLGKLAEHGKLLARARANRKLRRHVLYGAPKLHLRHRFGKTPLILGGPTARDAFTQRDLLIRLWSLLLSLYLQQSEES